MATTPPKPPKVPKAPKQSKKDLTLAEQLDAALKAGFPSLLGLNDKQDTKKVFRAAVGHGYSDAGPLALTGDQLDEWVQALLNRALPMLADKAPKRLEAAQQAVARAETVVIDAKNDEARTRATAVLNEALRRCALWERFEQTGDPAALHFELLEVARACARGMHTHDGKLVNADSKLRFFRTGRPRPEVLPYLFSDTAHLERQLSAGFAHRPDAGEPAIVFHAVFLLDGVPTSVAQLLQQQDERVVAALRRARLDEAVVGELLGIFAQPGELPNAAEPHIPQQLWPTEGGYVAIQALPSVAVYSALARESRRKREAAYLNAGQLQVGSGQAQNISIFASSSSGFLSLWNCVPPNPPSSREKTIQRQCFRKSLVLTGGRRAPKRDEAFEKEIWARPNDQRTRFLAAFARRHAEAALSLLQEARDLFVENDEDWESAVSALAEAEQAFVRAEPLSDAEMRDLVEVVFKVLPLESLAKHTPSDRDEYRALVTRAVTTACRN